MSCLLAIILICAIALACATHYIQVLLQYTHVHACMQLHSTCIDKALSSGRTCRLCCSVISSHQYLSLFTASSIRNKWPTTIQDLLGVSVSTDDGLPQHIRSVCRKRLEVLEQAALDSEAFQRQAKDASASLS